MASFDDGPEAGWACRTVLRCGTPQHGLYSINMALITLDCGASRSLGIKWPDSPRVVCPSRERVKWPRAAPGSGWGDEEAPAEEAAGEPEAEGPETVGGLHDSAG